MILKALAFTRVAATPRKERSIFFKLTIISRHLDCCNLNEIRCAARIFFRILQHSISFGLFWVGVFFFISIYFGKKVTPYNNKKFFILTKYCNVISFSLLHYGVHCPWLQVLCRTCIVKFSPNWYFCYDCRLWFYKETTNWYRDVTWDTRVK